MKINVKEITSRFEGVATMLGAYIESSIKENPIVDKQLKGFLQSIEGFVKETVSDKLSEIQSERKLIVKIKTLENFKGDLPVYETEFASGIDVRAQLENGEITLKPGERQLIPTGLSFEIPKGYEIQARPRSGWAIKQGISLVNSPGTIDADYRGEVKIILINLGQEDVVIEENHRVAQLVLCPVVQAEFQLNENLSETARGEGGFGSTGGTSKSVG